MFILYRDFRKYFTLTIINSSGLEIKSTYLFSIKFSREIAGNISLIRNLKNKECKSTKSVKSLTFFNLASALYLSSVPVTGKTELGTGADEPFWC